jgi:hypothetical protein
MQGDRPIELHQWKGLTVEQRIERGQAMAAEAQELAEKATGQAKKDCLAIAIQWLQLATDIGKSKDRPRRRS